MNYERVYNLLMQNAAVRTHQGGYVERHHCVPKALGGSNEKHNMVALTAREHFIAHRLLVRFLTGESKKKMLYPLLLMYKAMRHKNQYIASSRVYEQIKQSISKSRVGTRLSAKTKERISQKRKGVPMPESAKQKLRGRKIPKEQVDATRIKLTGKVRTQETRARMASSKMKPCSFQGKTYPSLSAILEVVKRDPRYIKGDPTFSWL